jgi:hypothetical protein
MPKLRDKYDQLRLQAQRNGASRNPSRPSTTDQRVADAQALKALYADEPPAPAPRRQITGGRP